MNSIFSSFAALYFSKVFSTWLYDYYFRPSMLNYLINILPECNFSTRYLWTKIPDKLMKILLNSGITFSNITHIIGNEDKEFLPERIIEIFKPIVIEFIRSWLSSICFILFIALGRLTINLILKILKLGALKNIGKVIGSIFGILKSYIIISIFMCCLKAVLPYCENKNNNLFSSENISSTKIFKNMYINNPIYEVFETMKNT